MSKRLAPYVYTVESIRAYINQELNGQHIPNRDTVEQWLEEYGQERIQQRIDDHLSFWKYLPKIKEIQGYIKQELGEQNIPQINTVRKWLEEFGEDGIKTRIEEHILYWKERDNPQVSEIQAYISQELGGRKIPRRQTIKKWLEQSGQQGIQERINQHISYWQPLTNSQTKPLSPPPSSPEYELLNHQGILLMHSADLQKALSTFDQALALKPDYYDAWINRGITLGILKKVEEAITSFDEAIKLNPARHEAWLKRGNAFCQLGLFEDALRSYDKALELSPDCDEAQHNKNFALGEINSVQPKIVAKNTIEKFSLPLNSANNTDEMNQDEQITQLLKQVCEDIYPHPLHVIYHHFIPDQEQIYLIFREDERGWYFEMVLTQKKQKWSSEYRVFPPFFSLLEDNAITWVKLTEKATAEDWQALDEIFINTLFYPDSQVMLAGADIIGEKVADQATERFGCYIPDEDVLPVFIFENRRLKMTLISFFKDRDGFAKQNSVMDEYTNQCSVFDSLKEAQEHLDSKLFYYSREF